MATSGDGRLTNRQIVSLGANISLPAMEAIAERYLNISSETIKSNIAINKGDAQSFNREMIHLWTNRNSDDQIKVSLNLKKNLFYFN